MGASNSFCWTLSKQFKVSIIFCLIAKRGLHVIINPNKSIKRLCMYMLSAISNIADEEDSEIGLEN